jgi:hypothetical protein
LVRVASVLLLFYVDACASTAPPRGAEAAPPAASNTAHVVNATIITNGCQSLGSTGARLAERAMYDLVEGCRSIPGGSARFYATLEPGGRIEIAAGHGQPELIPVCVVKHSLVHNVPLRRPCGLTVRLEETAIPMASPSTP